MPHTPGPWFATTRQGSWDWLVANYADPNTEICQMFHDGTDLNETGEANARLVAAAPELFAALRNMAEWWAYAMHKPSGAEPDAEDHRRVEQLATQAIHALHSADPTYVHRLPGSAN